MAKVSVVIPIYNSEKFIRKCIESCINQTLKDIEIIIVDDESEDNSLFIAKEYAKKDNRIKVYNQKNSGVSVSRNKGIDEATSEWITFLDGDDWIQNDFIEKMYNIAIKKNYDIVISGFYSNNRNVEKVERFLSINSREIKSNEQISLVKNCIRKTELGYKNSSTNIGVPWAKLYNVNYIRKNRCYFKVGLKRMQDMIFNLEAFYLAKKIMYINEPLYHYRIHENSATTKYTKDFFDTAKNILNSLKEFMNKYNLNEELNDYYNAKVLILFLEIIKLQIVPNQNKEKFIKKIKKIKSIRNKEPFRSSITLKLNNLLTKQEKILNIFTCLKMDIIIYILYKYKRKKVE